MNGAYAIELTPDNEQVCNAALVCVYPGCGWRHEWASERDARLDVLVMLANKHTADLHLPKVA